uniref:Uncharacterized protein n=1 Tax=viral metagenome TaxID=1070528 RepID=A0A6C0H298_9ZZZZ
MVWVYNRHPEPDTQVPVPAIAYVFIGLTSLVLAYFTAVDKNGGGAVVTENKEESAMSMLPSFSNTPEESQSESSQSESSPSSYETPDAVPIDDSAEKQMSGGKKKNKKSKRRKQKQNRSVRLSK